MTARLVLRLTGDNARFGELYASDLARLLDGIDRAVGRTAAQIAGRSPGAAGRLPKAITRATRRFARIRSFGDASPTMSGQHLSSRSIWPRSC